MQVFKNIIEEHTIIQAIRIMKFYQLNFENISKKYSENNMIKLDHKCRYIERKGKWCHLRTNSRRYWREQING